jgi:uncharacterized protein (TIGR02444 family)
VTQAQDTAELPLEGPHWSFALKLYGRPGVPEACLLLQDRAGVDVNILLFALYAAAERGVALTPRDLQEMDAAVAAWRSELILPLRSIRRRLKTGPEPAPAAATEALRSKVKAAELQAEQIEQAVLMHWLAQRAGQPERRPSDLGELVRSVVSHFSGAAGEPTESQDIARAIGTLTEQAAAAGPG